jgi:hypothetical protein
MGPADDVRFYELTRARLEHEDGLIVNRLSWLVGSQAFLFTAFAISAGAPPSAVSRVEILYRLVPWVGVVSTALIYAGLFAAARGMAWLLATYRARVADDDALGVPPIRTPRGIHLWGMAAPVLLPPVFLVAWIALGLSTFR